MRILHGMLLCSLIFVGCASSRQQQQDLAVIENSAVPAIVTMKMQNRQPLDLEDIQSLCLKKVNESVTLRYLQSTRSIYILNLKKITTLRAAGASDPLINYLLSTPSLYGYNKAWMQNSADNPTRDPLRNGQIVPRFY